MWQYVKAYRTVKMLRYRNIRHSVNEVWSCRKKMSACKSTYSLPPIQAQQLASQSEKAPVQFSNRGTSLTHTSENIEVFQEYEYKMNFGMMPKFLHESSIVNFSHKKVLNDAQNCLTKLHQYFYSSSIKHINSTSFQNNTNPELITQKDIRHKTVCSKIYEHVFQQRPYFSCKIILETITQYVSAILQVPYCFRNVLCLIPLKCSKKIFHPCLNHKNIASLQHPILIIHDQCVGHRKEYGFNTDYSIIKTNLRNMFDEYLQMSHSTPCVRFYLTADLPNQLPLEFSGYTSSLISLLQGDILSSNVAKPTHEKRIGQAMNADIGANIGKFCPHFQVIQDLREGYNPKNKSVFGNIEIKVLVLGDGCDAVPVVEYLTRDENVHVIMATEFNLDKYAPDLKNTDFVPLDVNKDEDDFEKLMKEIDLVICLLHHSVCRKVVESCIINKVNMVIAGELNPELQNYNQAAVDAGIIVLDGLCPGIEHIFALQCIDNIKKEDGYVHSLVSYCGTLPLNVSPENSLKFKFWKNPRHILQDMLSSARYVDNGEIVKIPAGHLMDHVSPVTFMAGYNLEAIPRGDSTLLLDPYGIASAKTCIRYNLRYQGFSEVVNSLFRVGLLNDGSHPCLNPDGPDISWKQLLCNLLGHEDENLSHSNFRHVIYDAVGECESQVEALDQLGILGDDPVVKQRNPLDTLANLLAHNLYYKKGETDIVIMRHDIRIRWPHGQKEIQHIDFSLSGDEKGFSAVAKSVGYSAAIAAHLILQEQIQSKGVLLPTAKEIYDPMLKLLKEEGLSSIAKTKEVIN